MSPVGGIQPYLVDYAWGREHEYRAFMVRKMVNGDFHQKCFWIQDHGERGAWIAACKHLAVIEGIDPEPLIDRYPGEAIWEKARALRRHNRGERVPKDGLEGTPYEDYC
ncbi:DNA helicase II (plasmid) [Thioalkalivibrio sp. K90mix]|nr:DNA helicase II [Thioalkalivibrio sp. K90mix]